MRGFENNNSLEFYKAEDKLNSVDIWDPINPARMDDDLYKGEDIDYKEAMKRDLDVIFESDAMYMLRGWEKSDGARAEHALAVYLGLSIQYQ